MADNKTPNKNNGKIYRKKKSEVTVIRKREDATSIMKDGKPVAGRVVTIFEFGKQSGKSRPKLNNRKNYRKRLPYKKRR